MKRSLFALFLVLNACILCGCSAESTSAETTEIPEISADFETESASESTSEETESATADEAEYLPGSAEDETTSSKEIMDNVVSNSSSQKMDELMTVYFLDVGQGDSTLITCGSNAILIDAGENNKGTYVQNFLEKEGVETIDLFIVTHFHSDHSGGADVIITKFDIETLWVSDFDPETATSRDVYEAAEYKALDYVTPFAGDTIQVGDMEVSVIAPAYSTYSDANNSSIGVIVRYGETSFLFTGDCEEEAEQAILSVGMNLQADVYQVGHHGSKTSSSEAFLDAVAPTWAVISCGEGNSYGHPNAQTLNNLRTRDIQAFRTDEQGTVVAYSDGLDITWNCSPSETWQSGEQTESNTEEEDEPEKGEGESEYITYIGNANSMKFHYSDCSGVSQMAEKNKVDLSAYTREEIIDMGYTPCGSCNP